MTRPDCPASPLSSLFPALLASLALGLGCAGCNSGSSSGPASYVPGDDTYVRMGSTLETARAEHALAPVGSGVVLVSGGATLAADAVDTAELFDTTSGVSRALGARMSAARARHVVAPISSNDALILGGLGRDGRALDSVEVFRREDESFAPLAARLATPRAGASALVVAGELWIVGGEGARSAERWDLSALRRVALVELPGPARVEPTLVAVGERVFVYGGAAGAAPLWLEPEGARAVEGALALRAGAVASPSGEAVWLIGGVLNPAETGGETKINRGVQRVHPSEGASYLDIELGVRREAPLAFASREDGVLIFAGQVNGFPVAEAEQLTPTQRPLPSLPGGRAAPRGLLLSEGVVLLAGGREADGAPSFLVDLILPPGAALRDGEQAYRAAAAERDASDARQGDLASAGADLSAAELERDRLAAELAATERQLADTRAWILRSSEALDAARDATRVAEARASQLAAEVSDLEQRVAAARQAAAQGAADLAAAEQALDQARADKAEADRRAEACRQAAAQLQAQINSARARIGQLEAERSSLLAQL